MGGAKGFGSMVVTDTAILAFMQRFLATSEGQATAEQFTSVGIQSYFIANPVEDDIAASVASWLAANPPADGQNATAAQVQEALDAYFALYPPQPGPQGEIGPVGPAGQSITQAELAAAVAAYLQANPPRPGATGVAGQNATAEQVAGAVAAYMSANPLSGSINSSIAAYFAANPIPTGFNTLVGTVVVGQVATTTAIILGVREVTISLAGAVRGERYLPFCRSYKLNNGLTTSGRPPGYAIIDAVSNANGQVTVSLHAPVLTVGSSYSLNIDIVKVNT